MTLTYTPDPERGVVVSHLTVGKVDRSRAWCNRRLAWLRQLKDAGLRSTRITDQMDAFAIGHLELELSLAMSVVWPDDEPTEGRIANVVPLTCRVRELDAARWPA